MRFDDDTTTSKSTFSPELVFRPSTPAPKLKKQVGIDDESISLGLQPIIETRFPTSTRRRRPPKTTTSTMQPNNFEISEETAAPTTITTTLNPTTFEPTTFRTVNRRRSQPRQTNPRRTAVAQTTTTERPPTTMSSTVTDLSELEIEGLVAATSPKSVAKKRILNAKPGVEYIDENKNVTKPRPPGTPQIPGNFGFLPSGKAFNIPRNVPGKGGEDYPIYDKIPITGFDCREQLYQGFYADMEAGCQVYHSCNGGLRGSKHTFLCPNGTIFSQEYLICDWWYNVNCEESPRYYPLNKEAFSSDSSNNKLKKVIITSTGKNKNKQTTTEFVVRTVTTTGVP